MLSKEYRFHGRHSLKFALSRGRIFKTDFFDLRYIRNTRRTNYRLAIVVGRKIDKRAVVRNRIRRRLFEVFRLGLADLKIPVDLVVIVRRKDLADLPAETVLEVCQTVFEKLSNIYRDS